MRYHNSTPCSTTCSSGLPLSRGTQHPTLTASTTLLVHYMEQQKKGVRTVCMDVCETWTRDVVPECTRNASTKADDPSRAAEWAATCASPVDGDGTHQRYRAWPPRTRCRYSSPPREPGRRRRGHREEAPRIKHIKKRIRSWTKSHFNGLLQQK